jgi:glutathione synthase/RimK-type ligase-like ATP-grasp enzyme
MTVALVTCAALPGLAADDRLLLGALRQLGVTVEPAVWEDPLYDWSGPRVCVIRSAWDYAYRRAAFVAWSRRAAAVSELWNPAPIVEWNTHKRYLSDLAARGVPAVPTVVLPAGSVPHLPDVVAAVGWGSGDVILKAAVAQTGRHLLRVGPADAARGQAHLDRLLPHEDLLVQPFLPAVTEAGEISLVFLDGGFSHAVRKRPAEGDFRVHDDYGGSVARVAPDAAELRAAEAAIAAAAAPLLYGRVDLVPGPRGPLVMELELVEPDLFLSYAPGAAERLARAIVARLG